MMPGQFLSLRFQSQPSCILHRALPHPSTTWRAQGTPLLKATEQKQPTIHSGSLPFCLVP